MQEEELVSMILTKLNVKETKIAIKAHQISFRDLFMYLILAGSIKQACIYLNITESALEHHLSRNIRKILPSKHSNTSWDNYLLSIIGYKRCSSCLSILNIDNDFGKSKICKKCDAAASKDYYLNNTEACKARITKHYLKNKESYIAKNAKRRAILNNAVVPWTQFKEIELFYINRPISMHVDHIIPLNGALVSGLHVLENLQYLSEKDNLEKYNKFTVE